MKICPLVLAFLFYPNLQAQKTDLDLSKFNISKFQNLREQGLNHYYLEDSTKLKLEEYASLYQLTLNLPNSHYSYSYQYYKTTLGLKRSGMFFQRNLIGTHKLYDLEGDVIEEIQNDTAFTFTLNELDSALIKDYDIHIMDMDKIIGVSMEDSFKPVYGIAYSVDNNPFGMWRFIQIDGKTGEILQDFEKAYECRAK